MELPVVPTQNPLPDVTKWSMNVHFAAKMIRDEAFTAPNHH
jgi:hypothetical protein